MARGILSGNARAWLRRRARRLRRGRSPPWGSRAGRSGPCNPHGVHAGDADGDVRYAVTPGPAEGVRDDHGGLDTGSSARASRSLVAEASGRRGAGRRCHRRGRSRRRRRRWHTKPWWVSEITMPRSMRTMRRLSRDDLDLARVLPVAERVALRERGRFDCAKIDQTALGLADYLVRHDEDVARRAGRRPRSGSCGSSRRRGGLRESPRPEHLQPFHGRAAPLFLRRASPAVSRSKARWGRSQTLTRGHAVGRPRGEPRSCRDRRRRAGRRVVVIRSAFVPDRTPSGEMTTECSSAAWSTAHVVRLQERQVSGKTRQRGRTEFEGPAPSLFEGGVEPAALLWRASRRALRLVRTILSGLTTQMSSTPALIAATTRPIMYRVSPPWRRVQDRGEPALVPCKSFTGTTADTPEAGLNAPPSPRRTPASPGRGACDLRRRASPHRLRERAYPRSSMPARSSPSTVSTTIPSTRPAYIAATPVAETSWPSEEEHLVRRPLSARPPTIGLTATFGRGRNPSSHAGQAQDRAYAYDRVRRADDDSVGAGDGRECLPTASSSMPRSSTPSTSSSARDARSTPGTPGGLRGIHRGDGIVAHRQHDALDAQSAGERDRHPVNESPERRRWVLSVWVARSPVAQLEPGVLAVAIQHVQGLEGLFDDAPSGRGWRCRRACT